MRSRTTGSALLAVPRRSHGTGGIEDEPYRLPPHAEGDESLFESDGQDSDVGGSTEICFSNMRQHEVEDDDQPEREIERL